MSSSTEAKRSEGVDPERFVVGNNPRGQKITDEFMDSARKTREFTTVTQESVSEAVVRVRLSKPGDKPAGRRRARAQANP